MRTAIKEKEEMHSYVVRALLNRAGYNGDETGEISFDNLQGLFYGKLKGYALHVENDREYLGNHEARETLSQSTMTFSITYNGETVGSKYELIHNVLNGAIGLYEVKGEGWFGRATLVMKSTREQRTNGEKMELLKVEAVG